MIMGGAIALGWVIGHVDLDYVRQTIEIVVDFLIEVCYIMVLCQLLQIRNTSD
jgi:hypothetical protein